MDYHAPYALFFLARFHMYKPEKTSENKLQANTHPI